MPEISVIAKRTLLRAFRTWEQLHGMSNVFEGEAAQSYVNNFESYKSQFDAFAELIESFAQKLDMAADTMETTDQALAKSLGQ